LPISWFGILYSLASTFTAWLNLISADFILLFSKLIILHPILMHYISFAMFPQLSSFNVCFIVPYILWYFRILLFMFYQYQKINYGSIICRWTTGKGKWPLVTMFHSEMQEVNEKLKHVQYFIL
jgi:hypothetical protein